MPDYTINIIWEKIDIQNIIRRTVIINKRHLDIFERIYNDYKKIIYNFLLIKTSNNADVATDVLSETFCAVLESMERAVKIKNMKSYLIRISYRKLCDYLRKKYHDENYHKYFDTPEKLDDSMAEDLHEKQQVLLVNMAIDNLKPVYKNVLRSAYIENKSQDEIASELNRSLSSVESILVRARKKLRVELLKLKGFGNG